MPKTIKVNLEVPDGVSDQAKESAEREAHEAAVLSLWQREEFTMREAAEELGLTYADFLDLLAAKGIPVVRQALDVNAVDEAERKLAGEHP
jgi:predicted HTH domain antitoxin